LTLAAARADDPQPTLGTAALEAFDRAVLEGPVVAAARALLGALLVRDDASGRRVARIVETEAYDGPGDRASHARAGRTPRTAVMFGPPGRAYVYLVYGMHHCLNVVCGPDGTAAAVLIRAVEPIDGIELMREARGVPDSGIAGDARAAAPRLGAGPARLCQALAIDRRLDGIDLLADGRLRLCSTGGTPGSPSILRRGAIASGPRIGVAYAGEWAGRPWRFGIAGHPSLSRPFPAPDRP
jgi:DNA-3-methyladenine glycosylase